MIFIYYYIYLHWHVAFLGLGLSSQQGNGDPMILSLLYAESGGYKVGNYTRCSALVQRSVNWLDLPFGVNF